MLIAREAEPPQRSPAQTTGPCRTYDTAVTSVTVAGPMRVTQGRAGHGRVRVDRLQRVIQHQVLTRPETAI
jgi:hypothetical protein